MNRIDLKQKARQNMALAPNVVAIYGVLLTVLYLLCKPATSAVLSKGSVVFYGFITNLLIMVIAVSADLGMMKYLDTKDDEKTTVKPMKMLFGAFSDHAGVVTRVALLRYAYTCLWSLLFVIPGIVKGYSYAMAPYILYDKLQSGVDDKDIKADEIITESRQMMNGYKLDLFILQLSFIGWAILSGITLGVGLIYLYPYMKATTAEFYKALKEKAVFPIKDTEPAQDHIHTMDHPTPESHAARDTAIFDDSAVQALKSTSNNSPVTLDEDDDYKEESYDNPEEDGDAEPVNLVDDLNESDDDGFDDDDSTEDKGSDDGLDGLTDDDPDDDTDNDEESDDGLTEDDNLLDSLGESLNDKDKKDSDK